MLRQPRPLVPFTFPFLGQSYARRILNTQSASLIADWQLGETSGTNAANAQGTSARDGTYTNGVTLNAATFTDGTPAPSFDGTNDVINVYSSSLNSAFNNAQGTLFFWAQASASGVWTDGATRYFAILGADASNRVRIFKSSANNSVTWEYAAGGTAKARTLATVSGTGWFSVALTWNKAGDQVIPYFNGSQAGTILTGLGTWTGSLASTTVDLGASNSSGASPWSGFMKYAALWTTPLSAGEIAALSTV
jgi:hypothetical protein